MLTSFDRADAESVGLAGSIDALVARMAALAQACGLDGAVASAREVAALRAQCGPGFTLVVPGVRPGWASADDQKRIVTPAEALRLGADYLVIGRPIRPRRRPCRRGAAHRRRHGRRAVSGVAVKICGLGAADALESAVRGGARRVGFVFYPTVAAQRRHRLARPLLAARVPPGVDVVGVFVEPEDSLLDEVLDPRAAFHAPAARARNAAPGRRIARARYGLPTIKAVDVAGKDDLARAETYAGVADRLMFDAKAPPGAALPGGQRRRLRLAAAGGARVARAVAVVGRVDSRQRGRGRCRDGGRARSMFRPASKALPA